MREGDPNVVQWQTWDSSEPGPPKTPPGMKSGGPWYPFAGTAVPSGTSAVLYRRPIVRWETETTPILAADRLGLNVSAQRNGIATVRLDDGAEVSIPVCAGDTVKVIGEAVEAALRAKATR